jgi:ankyrin repeat protein
MTIESHKNRLDENPFNPDDKKSSRQYKDRLFIDWFGNTPLHIAASFNYCETTKMLAEIKRNNFNLFMVNNEGLNAYDIC